MPANKKTTKRNQTRSSPQDLSPRQKIFFRLLGIAACVMILVVIVVLVNHQTHEAVTLEEEETNVVTVTSLEDSDTEIRALIDTEAEADASYAAQTEGAVYVDIYDLNTVYQADRYFFDWNEDQAYVTTLASGTTTTSTASWPVVWYEDEPYAELAWAADFFDFTYEFTDLQAVTFSEAADIETETVTLDMDLPQTTIVLLWYQDTTGAYSDELTQKMSDAVGICNVFSPTWFELQEDGTMSSLANEEWVTWAHENGMQVWALFSNGFVDDLTLSALSDAETRASLIQELLEYCRTYDLDGINMDFESMKAETCRYYVQFMRELAYVLRNEGYILSVDVSVPTSATTYYRRDLLADVCDYIMVMGYDEHYSVKNPGTTASLSFTLSAITGMLEEVELEKLILGVPFYTKLWTTTDDEVTQEALSMAEVEAFIEEYGAETVYDEDTGQNYVEVSVTETSMDETGVETNVTITYQIWIEDTLSMSARLALAEEYELPGVACWKAGMETSQIWDLLKDYQSGDG